MRRRAMIAILAVLFSGLTAMGQSNIDSVNKYGWAENVGWTNWRGAAPTGLGVTVQFKTLAGFIWGENVGWINVGDGTPAGPGGQYTNVNGTDFGVNVNSDGSLHGMAWGENIGWINLDAGAMASPPQPARIVCGSPLARLTGYIWSESVGWINLSDLTPGKYVAVDGVTTPIACDVNHDGHPDGLDVQAFVDAIILRSGSWSDVCAGDLESPHDGMIDLDDVVRFVRCLLSAP